MVRISAAYCTGLCQRFYTTRSAILSNVFVPQNACQCASCNAPGLQLNSMHKPHTSNNKGGFVFNLSHELYFATVLPMAVTGTRVTPVIGWLERDLQGCKLLQLSTAEVDTAFTVPIAHLLNPAFK
jgi:hypothetical protein